MKVKALLDKVKPETFIEDYLRNHGVNDTNLYLNPEEGCLDNPRFYSNMYEGSLLLEQAIHNNWHIGLLVDVDCDGMCSAALMRQFLNSFDIDPTIYIRKGKAHGLRASKDEDIVPVILDDEIQLLIVPDAGSNDANECQDLLMHRCHTLVLDHHKIEVDNLWAIVINHHLVEGLNTALSGTGVTSKFIQYYCQKYCLPIPYMDDLVAMSIISDSCDLTSMENRFYVHEGLHNVQNPLIKAMLPSAIKRYGLSPTGYSWAIIPLINAVCREEETDEKYKLFDAFSGHGNIEETLKMCRSAHNRQTKTVNKATEEIEPTLDLEHKVIIGFCDAGLANQIGLIANKFQSRYNKPTILLREASSTTLSGSLRSPVDLTDVVNESRLAKAMGHNQAAGVFVKKSNLKRLIAYLDKADFPLEPEIDVAGCISPKQINNKLCKACEDNGELWGQGLREPSFYINVEIDETNIQVFEKRTTTVKITVNGVDFLLFMATSEQVADLTRKGKKNLSLIVTLFTNTWNDVTSPQAKIKQMEIGEVEDKGWEDDF